jgi:hypothetical protein
MKYFSEAKFKDRITNSSYFLPYYLHADTNKEAIEAKTKLENGIKERYDLQFSYGPIPIIAGLNDESIRSAFSFSKGKLVRLRMNIWEFQNFQPDYELSFEENLSTAARLAELPLPFEKKKISSIIAHQFLPVQILHQDFKDDEELLVINVIR